ncbi:MAG: PAS domain-containing methyl-accepting chemotaxis protein [Turneriella sp.]
MRDNEEVTNEARPVHQGASAGTKSEQKVRRRNDRTTTNREKEIRRDATLLSRTDLKGIITYASKDFAEASEYDPKDMIGEPHNIVRHPEMPPAAFADLWNRIKAGLPWRGMVKNRAASGDHYWVEAQVASQFRNGKAIGIMSVRRPAQRSDIEAAENLYAKLNKLGKNYDAANPLGLKKSWLNARLKTRFFTLMAIAITSAFIPMAGLLLGVQPIVRIVVALSLGLLSIPVAIWFLRGFNGPLANAIEQLKFLAEGDLTRSIDVRGSNEIDKVLESVQVLNTSLSAIIFQLKENSGDLNSGSRILADSSQNLSAGVEQISQQSGVISAAATQMSQNLQVVSSAVEEMSISISEVAGKASETAKVSKEAADVAQSTQLLVKELGTGAANIGNVIEIISKIAEQTNMLALNASIEAAGAGEAGKGFAVVASEVKELARQTAASSEDIKKQIQAIQNSTENTVKGINKITDIIGVVSEGNTNIASAVEEQSMTTREIATNVSQISTAAADITKNISGISSAVNDSAKDAHKISELSGELNLLAQALGAIVQDYKVVR